MELLFGWALGVVGTTALAVVLIMGALAWRNLRRKNLADS